MMVCMINIKEVFNDRLSCSKTIIKKNIEVIPLNKYKTPTVSFADKDVTDEFIEYHSYKYHQTNVLGVLTVMYGVLI